MIAELAAVAGASVLGSLHCAGMCGGFVAFYSGEDSGRGGLRSALPHVAYNGGRLVTYSALGAIAGALGSAADVAGQAAGVGRIAAIVAGAVMLSWGLLGVLGALGSKTQLRLPGWVGEWVARRLSSLHARPPLGRALLLGLASTLLPCGWLYAFAVAAAGTGSPWIGAAVMAAFWSGTLPVMLGLGLGVQRLVGRVRRHVPLIGAVSLLVIGAVTLSGRMDVSSKLRLIEARTRAAAAPERSLSVTTPAAPAGGEALPCCHHD